MNKNFLPGRIGFINSLLVLILLFVAVATAIADDEQHERVVNSELPRGFGLASDYVADQKIDGAPAVIFADNFEDGELGAKWDETSNQGGNVLKFVDQSSETALLGRRSLKVTATLGENTGGGFTKWFESSDRLFIRFYTKFDAECDYVHHFATLRANKSLQGSDRWSGFGGAGNLPEGDERFSTAIEPWGNWGQWQPPGRWNFYSYWHTMQASPDGKYWGNGFRPESQPNIDRNQWICVEMMIKHNTPCKIDGEQAYWIDGELGGHWRGINWRTSPTLFANAFTLESYITDLWTKQKSNVVYFDNVVIAKEYIGPAKSK